MPDTIGIVVAAGRSTEPDQRPAALQRLVRTLQLAGAGEVVVACERYAGLQRHLAYSGAVFLHREGAGPTEMLDYVKLGLSYARGSCKQVLLTPLHASHFSPDTAAVLMQSGARVANPVYGGRRGHPLLLSGELIPHILDYQGGEGLRGALAALAIPRTELPVEDPGILPGIPQPPEQAAPVFSGFDLRLRLVGDQPLLGPGSSQLLGLIQKTGSVRQACDMMGISYSKGWKIIGEMERQLGRPVVVRQQGGASGGGARVTAEGMELVECYQRFCR